MQQATHKSDKLFIVDDDALTANLYRQHLLNLGYKDISVFSEGQECLNALVEEPQIIFLDHQMKNLNGVETLRKIKRFDPNIYVVFVSGQEEIETAVQSLKYGAFDYITKGDGDMARIELVLKKIEHVRDLLNRKDPGFLRKMISFIL